MAKEHFTIYKRLVNPLLKHFDSEKMHSRTAKLLHFVSEDTLGLGALLLKHFAFKDPLLHVNVKGIRFENPVLVGAGWDKNGEAVSGLIALGFGGVEVGTVTEYPQPGNPKPRQFVVTNGVVIQSLGFNSPGMEKVAHTLDRYRRRDLPIGVSLGRNKTASNEEAPRAYGQIVDRLYDYGKYFVVNVSSPNTPGLRELQDKKPLMDIIHTVQKQMAHHGGQKPLFVKIAPDIDTKSIDGIIDVIEQAGLAGIIATNTTLNQEIKGKYFVRDTRLSQKDENGRRRTWAQEPGGLSGDDPDYREKSTEIVRYIYDESKKRGLDIVIIGVGGIKDTATALEKIKAGASLIQLVTGIRGEGPGVAGQINRGIVAEMQRLGLTRFEDLVGYNTKYH